VLRPTIVKPGAPRPPKYGPRVVAALIFCWAVPGLPAGKRLAPILPEFGADLTRVWRAGRRQRHRDTADGHVRREQWPQQPVVQFGVEDRESQSVAGEPVAVLARDAGDEPVGPQRAKS
jgi:hypothetical protein